MKQRIHEQGAAPINIWTDHVEDMALTQLKNLSRLPFIAGRGLAVMPDVHAGKGSTVGSVIATKGAIIPAAVGVDIGCGVNAVRLSLKASDLPENLKPLRLAIEKVIPLGAGGRHDSHNMQRENEKRLPMPSELAKAAISDVFAGRSQDWKDAMEKASTQLGTLGSGNHFIEVCIDESQDVWVMLHSGSRGIGNIIGSHFIDKAKEEIASKGLVLDDPDLAHLVEGTDLFEKYTAALGWAQEYALQNRAHMMEAVILAIRKHIPKDFVLTSEAVSIHHNYAQVENHDGEDLWITRKGATRAGLGELGVIPGSMGDKSYIVRGKGSPESYCSCSHGAGRRMSRNAAKKAFSTADLQAQTAGVECRKDADVLDELPSAYKPIDEVMANQQDLVEVVHTLKQVLCVKGA